MKQYLQALDQIIENGKIKTDRTGVGTRSVFGLQMRFNLQDGFPAVTTKKLAWRSVVSELLWFLEGSGDERRLAEILHGTRDSDKKTIWSANAEADYWKTKAKFNGDLGRVYGVQWRHWRKFIERGTGTFRDEFGNYYQRTGTIQVKEIDQLTELINGIKQDPRSRRHILSAWNPGELDQMALPPCHVMSQFDVTDGRLSCQLYQRSADFPLGVPFNIASYSLLTHMIAQICNLEVGEFIWTGGDCHIYENQLEGVKQQLSRQPLSLPKLWLNSDIDSIDKFTIDDIKLVDYQHLSPIQFEFAV